jgi:hypothetical protein
MTMRDRLMTVLIVTAAAFVAAGGCIHLREWLDTYRNVPASVPGAAVVRVGFPVNAAVSLVLAIALLATVGRWKSFLTIVAASAFAFEAASLASLILSRTGSVLGWKEPVWTDGANQARLVEVIALVALAGVLVAPRFLSARRRFV